MMIQQVYEVKIALLQLRMSESPQVGAFNDRG